VGFHNQINLEYFGILSETNISHNKIDHLDITPYAGNGYIKSTLKLNNGNELIPVQDKILLFDIEHRKFLRGAASDPLSGEFEFKYLALKRPYLLYSLDNNNNYKLASTGPIYAKPMPRD
jgi:hypothetical protein